MATREKKEKKVKAVKKKEPEKRSGTEYVSPARLILELTNSVVDLNQRIDNIVAAHERCKSLKGL